ncbi:hypothetical protein ZIOFF_031857 [Zingiber officinale]|uniref:C3HC-type domain-containing protein n=1 Tax=Zingiber officinale TaxID=94328 RepID=A0A8J5GUM0_ZINOF|nr:hypothetical protein ZIOFF_031857 [Zingiber officinale]
MGFRCEQTAVVLLGSGFLVQTSSGFVFKFFPAIAGALLGLGRRWPVHNRTRELLAGLSYRGNCRRVQDTKQVAITILGGDRFLSGLCRNLLLALAPKCQGGDKGLLLGEANVADEQAKNTMEDSVQMRPTAKNRNTGTVEGLAGASRLLAEDRPLGGSFGTWKVLGGAFQGQSEGKNGDTPTTAQGCFMGHPGRDGVEAVACRWKLPYKWEIHSNVVSDTQSSSKDAKVDQAVETFAKQLDAGHKDSCSWRGNCCADSLVQFPPMLPSAIIGGYKDRCDGLLQFPFLPVVASSAIETMRLTRSSKIDHMNFGELAIERRAAERIHHTTQGWLEMQRTSATGRRSQSIRGRCRSKYRWRHQAPLAADGGATNGEDLANKLAIVEVVDPIVVEHELC